MAMSRILIVDDEDELRENLFDLLDFKGYRVTAVSTGEEAIEQFKNHAFDLVLLDIQLPGIDGLAALRQMKAIHPEIPIVMVSASSVRGVLAQAEEFGAERTILKPYTSQEMLDTVEELLNQTKGSGASASDIHSNL